MLVCRGSHFHFRAFWRPPAFSCHDTLRLGAPLQTHHYNRMLKTMVGRTRIIYECMLFLSEWNVGPTYCTRAAHTFTITVYHCVPSNHGRLRYVSNAFHSFSGVAMQLEMNTGALEMGRGQIIYVEATLCSFRATLPPHNNVACDMKRVRKRGL